jgi:hypothetical protein
MMKIRDHLGLEEVVGVAVHDVIDVEDDVVHCSRGC